MSAADLFKDCHDVEFRLKGTYIMIGREAYYVRQVYPDGPIAGRALLVLNDFKDNLKEIRLEQLPLRTMTACPYGYYNGTWYARGPSRNRYQGITGSDFWCVYENGAIENCGVGNVKPLLQELPRQPRTRRPGKKLQGAVTRDVFIGSDGKVLIRGRHRGEYAGNATIKPRTELSPLSLQLLNNARLSVLEPYTTPIPMPMMEFIA